MAIGGGWPTRGPLCPHCNLRIPQFADLPEADERRVRELIRKKFPSGCRFGPTAID
jgi:hypothetical protein